MKKVYERPFMYCEEFQANEYVAACGDSGTVYNFKCDAGQKSHTYNIYYENGTEYLTQGIKYYNPCGTTHEAESDGEFFKGYIIETEYTGSFWDVKEREIGDKIPVYVWKGERGNNGHCTSELDMSKWETAKS